MLCWLKLIEILCASPGIWKRNVFNSWKCLKEKYIAFSQVTYPVSYSGKAKSESCSLELQWNQYQTN